MKNRVQNNMKALTREAGEEHEEAEEQADETPTIGTRLTRSASQPIGTAPSTKNAADAVLMKTIVPSLIPNVSRISGASTLIAAPSSSSNELRSVRTTNMNAPPTAMPSRSEIGSELTPGKQVVGEDDLLARLRLRGLARLFLVDDCGRERRRSEFVGHP